MRYVELSIPSSSNNCRRRRSITIKTNSVALVRKRTIPIERAPLVGIVSVQLLPVEGVAWSAQRIPTAVNLSFLDPEPLIFHSTSSSVILMRLSGPRSRPTTS
jgi:hypothetical protein